MLQPRKGPIVYRHYRDVCSFDTHQSPQTKNGLACKYKNKIWLQFLFIVIAAILKQQISKFYPQIQRTEASDHIYFSQQPVINVKAIFCAYNGGFYNEEKLKPVFVFITFAVLLGEVGKVDNVVYNSTIAYSMYGTFDTNKPSH